MNEARTNKTNSMLSENKELEEKKLNLKTKRAVARTMLPGIMLAKNSYRPKNA